MKSARRRSEGPLHALTRGNRMNTFFARSRLVIRRRAAAKLLLRREQEFKALVENTPDLIARFDRELRRRYVNPAIERLTGRSASELVGTTLRQRNFDARFVDTLEDALRQTFESGTETTVDVRLPGRNGEIRMQARIVPEFGVDGTIETALVISRDVTSLHRSEERLRSLIENAQDAILTLDREGTILEVNPAFVQMMAESAADIIGRRLLDFVLPDLRDEATTCFRSVAGRGERSRIATAFRNVRGEVIHVEAAVSSQSREGVEEVFVIVRDVTERRRVQEELESANRMAALGRVSMLLSDQFNNVLMGIQPFAELVLRATEEPRTRDLTSRIITSVARGRRITEDLRAFTHPQPMRLAVLDAGILLRDSLTGLRELLPAGIGLEVEIDEQPRLIEADAEQLGKALENVVLNAVDALAPRGGTIRVRAFPEGDATLRMVVADEGEGLDQDTLAHATEPFFTTRHSRAGLGLTTARKVVEAHGGSLQIDSARGSGTTVELRLPLSLRSKANPR